MDNINIKPPSWVGQYLLTKIFAFKLLIFFCRCKDSATPPQFIIKDKVCFVCPFLFYLNWVSKCASFKVLSKIKMDNINIKPPSWVGQYLLTKIFACKLLIFFGRCKDSATPPQFIIKDKVCFVCPFCKDAATPPQFIIKDKVWFVRPFLFYLNWVSKCASLKVLSKIKMDNIVGRGYFTLGFIVKLSGKIF